VQGAHAQILPWTDDTSIAYEQFRIHAHYGRLPNARRQLRGSPRLGDAADAPDEGAILAALVAGLGGAFLKAERALVAELRAVRHPPGTDLLALFQTRRMELLAARGFDVSGFQPDQMTSADDVYCFPNLVGPIYPGSAILFRCGQRLTSLAPSGYLCSVAALARRGKCPSGASSRLRARDWGGITTQDYENLTRAGGRALTRLTGLRLNPEQRQPHMHRVIEATTA
jgi:hypothetical protein